MRLLLRVLSTVLGLALATAGLLLVIEVVAAWVRPAIPTGLVVPWADWRATLERTAWMDSPVPAVAIGVAGFGLLLALTGLLARRSDLVLRTAAPEITVTTSPRVLARIVGRRVRAVDDVAGAAVTATRRRISVSVQGWDDPGRELREAVADEVGELLDELPLGARPRVSVSVQERTGPR